MPAIRWGLVIVAGLIVALVGIRWERDGVFAQRVAERSGPQAGDGGQFIALTTPGAEGEPYVTLIDPQLRSIGVYHIDPVSGEISLKSVRNYHWDLLMDEFNGVKPLPRELRAMLESR